jgi:phosphoesterase RecJ-like protein
MTLSGDLPARFEAAGSAVLIGHAFPDGDCVGSALGLAHAMIATGRAATVASVNALPESLARLPGADRITVGAEAVAALRADLLVLLDCAAPERTGLEPAALSRIAPFLANVDHHRTNRGFGDAHWVQPDAVATGEVVIQLLDTLGWPITPEAATCLFVSLITDSRGFRGPDTQPATLRLAARLMEAGADGPGLMRQVLGTRTPAGLRLLGRGLSKVRFDRRLPVAWLVLTERDYLAAAGLPEEGEELVDFLQGVPGYPVAVFIRPAPDGSWRIGLRSPGEPDVSRIAERLGGGGHRGAAGASQRGSIRQVRARVRRAVAASLDRPQPV